MKLKILIADDETRALRETAKKAGGRGRELAGLRAQRAAARPPDASASGEFARSTEDRR